jgi:hypothetical protein
MFDRDFSLSGFQFEVSDSDTIADGPSLSSLSASLNLGNVPLPEMVYARNGLSIKHADSGLSISFTAAGALRAWNARQIRTFGDTSINVERYDWTYSCDYNGDCNMHAAPGKNSENGLPMDRLTRRGPILFFASFPLYASDLNDRGLSECTIKLRVMEDCFLVLVRSFVRVDRERVYLRDLRYCHVFKDADKDRNPTSPISRTLSFDPNCHHGAPAPGSAPDTALAISQFVTKLAAIPASDFMQLLELMVEFEKAQSAVARSSDGILILRAASIDAFVAGKYDLARSYLSSALFFEASSKSDHFVSQLFKETPDKNDKGYVFYTSKLDILQNLDLVLEELKSRQTCNCLKSKVPIILRDLQLRTAVLPEVIERNLDEEISTIPSGQMPSFFSSPHSPLGKLPPSDGTGMSQMFGSAISPPSTLIHGPALSPSSQRVVHPVVLESIRERAARSGGSPKTAESDLLRADILHSPGSFVPADVAAKFLSSEDIAKLRTEGEASSPHSSSMLSPSPPIMSNQTRRLPNKLDISAEDVYESIECEVTELLELS